MTATLATVVGCVDLDAMVAFFVEECGGRVESISPADDPQQVSVSLAGSTIVLRRAPRDDAIRIVVRDPAVVESRTVVAPGGTTVEFRPLGDAVVVPAARPSLSIVRAGDRFGTGRAGMEYRDLLPDRWGGAFIASHIRIAGGGDVADYVHHHRVRFQMIYCARGWVDLVYEDQGEPFRLDAGDCVLQPPGIRHRVLRASPGLEVIEVGCPAVHDTLVEHEIALPTATFDPDRRFDGQRFVRHVAARAERRPYPQPGLVGRDTGIGAATDGLASAVVVGAETVADPVELTYDGEFAFVVVLSGSAGIRIDDGDGVADTRLAGFDAVAFPPGATWAWSDWSADFEFLEISLPSSAVRSR
jgi:uncharacterized protein YjlB